MGLNLEIPVFVETNLGTRIVLPISQGITAANLKREIKKAHINIFPELGFLSIHALMVKRESRFYHLPDSIRLKQALWGFRNFCLLHAQASLLEMTEKTSFSGSVVSKKRTNGVPVCNGKKYNKNFRDNRSNKHSRRRFWCLKAFLLGLVVTTYLLKKKRKSRHLERKVPKKSFPKNLDKNENNGDEVLDPLQVSDSYEQRETPCESISEVISVSGIIDRYFTGFIEVGHMGNTLWSADSMCAKKQDSLHTIAQTVLSSPLPEELISSVGLRKYERSEVGKRLVTASNSLVRYQNSHGSHLFKDNRLWDPGASSIVRNLVFEIDDID